MQNNLIQFIKTKDYKLIAEIGQGGTGRTVLLEDETIDERFVCKKYSPFHEEYRQIFFSRFKNEIKLLYLLNHKNIVRVFNYYLYPEHYTGYILMEYIQGKQIDIYIKENPDKLNGIFEQTIHGFSHLEKKGILHRDIRPENIMISIEGLVKIIDFGFSKKTNIQDEFEKSVSLNWRYNPPMDFAKRIYNFKTEIYFIGKMFEEIIIENNLTNFKYTHILELMNQINPLNRISSFEDVEIKLFNATPIEDLIDSDDKYYYQSFASSLTKTINRIDKSTSYTNDVSEIIRKLGEIYRDSILEETVQDNISLVKCFISGGFSVIKSDTFSVEDLGNFYNLLHHSPKDKQKMIINHIWRRLDQVKRFDDDIPF